MGQWKHFVVVAVYLSTGSHALRFRGSELPCMLDCWNPTWSQYDFRGLRPLWTVPEILMHTRTLTCMPPTPYTTCMHTHTKAHTCAGMHTHSHAGMHIHMRVVHVCVLAPTHPTPTYTHTHTYMHKHTCKEDKTRSVTLTAMHLLLHWPTLSCILLSFSTFGSNHKHQIMRMSEVQCLRFTHLCIIISTV